MCDHTLTNSARRKLCRVAINSFSIEDLGILEPQRRIPNVRRFNVKLLSDYHPVLQAHNIRKRQYEPIFESEPYLNRPLNRYISHQFKRLNKHRGNPKVFWRISEHLLNRSSSYIALCLYETFPGWHRNKEYEKVWCAVREMRQLDLRKYEHKYTEIPKPSGGTRGLNIPSEGWRLLLHGLNRILQIWLSPYQHPNQHGFTPHRGTKSAWHQIHTEVLQSRDIYEFDLRKFFDTLNLDYLTKLLMDTQIPRLLVQRIIRWSRTPAQGTPPSAYSWKSANEEACDYRYHKTGLYGVSSAEESYWLSEKRKSEQHHPHLKRYDYYRGVAQGSPISPLISTIILTKVLLNNPNCDIVQYADDGILYNLRSSIDSILTFPPESGVEVNWSKSRWLKRCGKWLHPLKFLGLEYNPLTSESNVEKLRQGGTLSNSTRIPKSYTLDCYSAIESAWAYDKVVSPTTGEPRAGSFLEWFRSHYHGYLMSMLYKGTTDLTTALQNFNYTYKSQSWAALDSCEWPYWKIDHRDSEGKLITLDVFNSSSFAHRSIVMRISKTLSRKPLTGFRY